MLLDISIASGSIGLSLITGYIVWAKNQRKRADIIYLLASFSYILLSVSNLFSTLTAGAMKLFFARWVMLFSLLGVILTYRLVEMLRSTPIVHFVARSRLSLLATISMLVLSISPFVLEGFDITPEGERLRFGWGMILFSLGFGMYLVKGVFALLRGIRGNADPNTRSQFSYMLIGFMPVILLAPFTGIYLPAIRGDFRFISLTPIYTACFVVMVGYAMVKSKLFDIKSYVVRGIGYTVASVLLGIVYIAPLLYGFCVLTGIEILLWRFILAVVVFSIGATYYGTLQLWFRNASRRLFFQDMYEPADVLSQLNHELVSVVNIETIFNKTSKLILNSIKPEYAYFVLRHNDNGRDYRFIGVDQVHFTEVTKLLHKVNRLPENVIVISLYDEVSSLSQIANKNDIAVIVKINSKATVTTTSGYIILGSKKNGSAYTQQDVKMLGTMANTLVISVQNALQYEEIGLFNETLQQKVEDATKKLRKTNERLKKLDETKDEFVSMASHQLRTPLTSVKGYLSMVLEGDAGPLNPQQADLLKQSFMSSQRMVNLIADLLNLSRLSTGKFVVEATPTDLRVVIDQEVAQLRETAKAKDIELVWHMPPTATLLPLDDGKIHQVVMNFIDNGLYYTPPGGRVEISLVETPKAIEYRVKDTGIGVPRELQRHLFTKFYRADNARRMRPDGTGLGLYMAKKIVVAQGGSIIFESRENHGSTFGFRFRKPTPEDPAAPTPTAALSPKPPRHPSPAPPTR